VLLELKMELDWLKKIRDQPIEKRGQWVNAVAPLALIDFEDTRHTF